MCSPDITTTIYWFLLNSPTEPSLSSLLSATRTVPERCRAGVGTKYPAEQLA
jgi:hypothetical protein